MLMIAWLKGTYVNMMFYNLMNNTWLKIPKIIFYTNTWPKQSELIS